MITLFPPFWLIQVAVAAVWFYEGLWCKLLHSEAHTQIVEAVPDFGARPRIGTFFLKTLGVMEIGIAMWVLNGIAPVLCALVQTLLLITVNAGGLFWARHIIHDPGGMVVKNFAFLVLVWVAASQSGWV